MTAPLYTAPVDLLDAVAQGPGCQPVDRILPWRRVKPGDRALDGGRLRLIDDIGTRPGGMHVAIRFAGSPAWLERRASNLTAVRRYAESPPEPRPQARTEGVAGRISALVRHQGSKTP